jgi:two-component system, chemotaxis family, chemotaxis protein CheY
MPQSRCNNPAIKTGQWLITSYEVFLVFADLRAHCGLWKFFPESNPFQGDSHPLFDRFLYNRFCIGDDAEATADISRQCVENPKIILLVEDHTDTAEMLCLILESEGYQVRSVSNAAGALNMLSGEKAAEIDLVLLDLTLPDMNGDEVIQRIRQQETSIPPVLIMSAKPAASLEHAAQSIGAAGIIRKPFDVDSLLETLRATIP